MAMDSLSNTGISDIPDLGHRLRRLDWFRKSFEDCASMLSRRHRLTIRIDDELLAKAFLQWLEIFEEKRRYAAVDRADYILFAGGLMLKELIRNAPAKITVPQDGAGDREKLPESLAFWPEGFLYTHYCISAVSAVHLQQFGQSRTLSESVEDLRTWWSFRENATEMPGYAVAFLDRFFGSEPNWAMPDIVDLRHAMAGKAGGPALSDQHAHRLLDKGPEDTE